MSSLGISSPWEGQSLRVSKAPRCQSIRTQRIKGMVNAAVRRRSEGVRGWIENQAHCGCIIASTGKTSSEQGHGAIPLLHLQPQRVAPSLPGSRQDCARALGWTWVLRSVPRSVPGSVILRQLTPAAPPPPPSCDSGLSCRPGPVSEIGRLQDAH